MSISIGDFVFETGTRGHGVLTVPDALPDGSPIEVPFVVINGARSGPTLFLSNGHDAFEIQGIEAIRRALSKINPKKLSGKILYCLPNPIAFRQRLHQLTIHNRQPQLGLNVNMYVLDHYPGKPDGGLVERITNMIWTNMIEDKADCVIDFHTRGGWGEGPNWVNYPYPGPSSEKSEELAKAFGTEFVFRRTPPDSPNRGNIMRGLCHERGIPNFAPEGGSGGFEFREDVIGVDARGIMNVMKKLDMIEGKPELPRKQYHLDMKHYRKGFVVANKSGFFVKAVNFMQNVKKEETLGIIYSARTLEALETLKANTDGVVWHLPEYPLIYAGEAPVSVMYLGDSIEIIENL